VSSVLLGHTVHEDAVKKSLGGVERAPGKSLAIVAQDGERESCAPPWPLPVHGVGNSW